jgi:esterase/lipase superfamily enzyme
LLEDITMKKVMWLCAILSIVVLLLGCSGSQGKKKLPSVRYSGMTGKRSLVVLFPTIGGKGAHYESQGFLDEVWERGFEASMEVLDIKPSLYLGSRIVELVKTEVIEPAKAEGFEEFYLVGISLGGHGALLYATTYPEDVDGIVLLAPFISGEFASEAIDEAGGLETWEDCPFLAWTHACNLWKSLQVYVSDSRNQRKVVLGFGTEDIFVEQCRILAEVLLPEQVFTVPGGHDWITWKKLFIKAADYFLALKIQRDRKLKSQPQ